MATREEAEEGVRKLCEVIGPLRGAAREYCVSVLECVILRERQRCQLWTCEFDGPEAARISKEIGDGRHVSEVVS